MQFLKPTLAGLVLAVGFAAGSAGVLAQQGTAPAAPAPAAPAATVPAAPAPAAATPAAAVPAAPAPAAATPAAAVPAAPAPAAAAPATIVHLPEGMKVGAVVQLKSGGPKMTVTEIAGTTAKTQWQQEKTGKPTAGEFPIAGLKIISEKDEDSDDGEDDDEEDDEEEDDSSNSGKKK